MIQNVCWPHPTEQPPWRDVNGMTLLCGLAAKSVRSTVNDDPSDPRSWCWKWSSSLTSRWSCRSETHETCKTYMKTRELFYKHVEKTMKSRSCRSVAFIPCVDEVPSHKALARCLAEMAADAINERAKLRRRQVQSQSNWQSGEKRSRVSRDHWKELNFITFITTCYPKEV